MCTVSIVYGLRTFLGKKEDIVPEHCKSHDYELVSIRWKICPVYINFTAPQYENCRTAMILQFLINFIQLLF